MPQDAPESANTLIYIILHDGRGPAADRWKNFDAETEWRPLSRASQVEGRIVSSVVLV